MPFYDHTRSVSKDQPCLLETIEIMWGLDDLLDDIQNSDSFNSKFGDISDDIRDAFKAGIETVDNWMKDINDNIMYYAAHILDPRIKTILIRE
jgi:hypothetical protein